MKTCDSVIVDNVNRFGLLSKRKIYRHNIQVKQKNSKASLSRSHQ